MADLQNRSRELDLREQILADKESILNTDKKKLEVEILNKKIDVLNGKLDFNKKELASIGNKIRNKIIEAKNLSNNLDKKVAKKKSSIDEYSKKLEALTQKYEDTTNLLAVTKAEKSDIDTQVAERRKYLDEQEAAIDRVALEANDRLHEMEYEAKKVEDTKAQDLTDIVRLEQNKTELEAASEELDRRLGALKATYEGNKNTYVLSLTAMRDKVAKKQDEYNVLGEMIEATTKELKIRENALTVKEIAYTNKAKDLEYKERRIKSNYDVAGESWA